MAEALLRIDGSLGAGGGQILRSAVGLAAALWGGGAEGRLASGGYDGLEVVNIRAGRPKPGLRPQHLAAVNAAAAVCGARVDGAGIGSTSLTFRPGRSRSGRYRFDIGTAGSTSLVLQTVLPALLAAEGDSEVVVTGGTHNPFSPCFEYVRDVFVALASAANAALALHLERAGFYPAGGGQVRCQIRGLGRADHVAPLRLTSRGRLKCVEGVSAAAESLPAHIVERQRARAIARLRKAGLEGSIEQARMPAESPGTVVFLRAVFSRSVAGFFSLGRKGKSAERVADEAVDELLEFLDADGAVDPHAADQLITLLAMAPATSELTTTRISQHLLTNAEVIRRITGREVIVEGKPDSPGSVMLK